MLVMCGDRVVCQKLEITFNIRDREIRERRKIVRKRYIDRKCVLRYSGTKVAGRVPN